MNVGFKLEKLLNNEYHQLPLLYFSSFLFGILAYFSLEYEPDLRKVLYLFAASFSLLYLRRFGVIGSFFSIVTIFFVAGILAGTIRTHFISPSTLPHSIKTHLSGRIDSIKPKITGTQIIISNVKFEKEIKNPPHKIRVNVRTDVNGATIGDYVKLYASLSPPPRAALPGSYDFSRGAFFANIGAVGYALSNLYIVGKQEKSDIFSLILELRRKIYVRIIDAIGPKHGNFAAAIMLGETSALERNVIQSMRAAGISHILAVSGLHLSLVAMICFFIFRMFFNIIPYTAHYTDVKQIAAIFALLGSFFYLLISGMQVAAIRAFIMTSIVILAIIFKRFPSPMRSVCFAAFLILLIYPEYALHPSFHLSFVAVISLLAGYELYVSKFLFSGTSSIFYGLKLYIFSNIYSTIIASIATAPFVIYHFYIYSNYSVLANLVAVPLTSFILMPAAIFTFFLLPIHLEYVPLKCMDFAIGYILQTARYIETLPYSIWYFGHISSLSLFIYTIGFLWGCFLKTNLRLIGLVPIIISFIMMLNTQKPDLIIGGRDHAIAINKNGTLVIEDSVGSFVVDYWTSWFGQQNPILEEVRYLNYDLNIKNNFVSVQHFNAACTDKGLIINLSYNHLKCDHNIVINKKDIQSSGTHLIFINKKGDIEIVDQLSRRFRR
jgi:competence protein ComEC